MKNKILYILLSLISNIVFLQAQTNILNVSKKLNAKWGKEIYFFLDSQLPKINLDNSVNKAIAQYIYGHTEENLPQKWFFNLQTQPVFYIYVPDKIYLYKNFFNVKKAPFYKSYIMNNQNIPKILGNDIYFIPMQLNVNQPIQIVLFNKEITKTFSKPLLLATIYPNKLINKARHNNLDIYHSLYFFKKTIVQDIKEQLQKKLRKKVSTKFLEMQIFNEYEKQRKIKCPTLIQIKQEQKQFEWESKKNFLQRIKRTNKLISTCNNDYKKFHIYFKQKVKDALNKLEKNINQVLKYALNSQQIDNLTLYLLNKYIGPLKIKTIKRDYKNGKYTYLKIISKNKYNNIFFINAFFKIRDKNGKIYDQLTKKRKKQFFFNRNTIIVNDKKNLTNHIYPILGKYNGKITLFLINEYDWKKNISFTLPMKKRLNGLGNISNNSYFISKQMFKYQIKKISNNKTNFNYYIYNVNIFSPIKTFWFEKKPLKQVQNETVSLNSIQNETHIEETKYLSKKIQINLVSNMKINVKSNLNLPILKTKINKLKIKFPKWFLKKPNTGYGYDKDLNLAILKAKQNLLIQTGKIFIKAKQQLNSIKGNFVDYQVINNEIEESANVKNIKIKIIKKEFLDGYWFIAVTKSNKN